MKKVLTLVVAGIVCATFIACQRGAAGLSDQDKAAIRKVTDDAVKIAASPKADFGEYVKLYYAEDATVLAANMPPLQGRPALQAFFASFPPMSDFKPEIVDIDGHGDLAYVRGNYSLTMNPPGAPPVTEKGKYLEVWKKSADGAWKVSYDSFSPDAPPPGLVVPTGAMAANASAEVKKLGDMVGKWQITGTFKPDPKAKAGPVDMALDCQWYSSGVDVACVYSGISAGQPYREVDLYSYDSKTKTYTDYSVSDPGGAMLGRLTIKPGTWVHTYNTFLDGKPAMLRLTLSNVSAAGGDWMNDVSVAGSPWTVLGQGKYVKAK